MLLGRGADVNAHGNFHISSLLWAAGRGSPDIVKDLIAHGAKVNVGDKVMIDELNRQSIVLSRSFSEYARFLSFLVWYYGTCMGIAQRKRRNR